MMMDIFTAEIHEEAEKAILRKMPASPEEDAALVASLQVLGLLQPIAVRAGPEGWFIVTGRRRLAAARRLGWTQIPAIVLGDHGDHLAAEAAENMVRASMTAVDQWRAMSEIIHSGMEPDYARRALGLSQREGKRLLRLGDMAPDMLAAVEKYGLPNDRQLQVIAMAPHLLQNAALKNKAAWSGRGNQKDIIWAEVANLCWATRIPLSRAAFDADTAGVVFEEDLFAEPGSDEQFMTTDLAGFRAAQEAAAKAMVAALVKNGYRAFFSSVREHGSIACPAGWESVAYHYKGLETPPFLSSDSTQAVFYSIEPSTLGVDAMVAREIMHARDTRKSPTKRAEAQDVPTISKPEPRIKKAGHLAIAKAKTFALRQKIEIISQTATLPVLLNLLLLSLTADNVRIADRWKPGDPIDMAELPEQAVTWEEGIGRRLASMVMGSTLACDASGVFMGSGHVADQIGAIIDAASELPRFDTEDFLDHVPLSVLRPEAKKRGISARGAALRGALVGQMPDWRPDEAAFRPKLA